MKRQAAISWATFFERLSLYQMQTTTVNRMIRMTRKVETSPAAMTLRMTLLMLQWSVKSRCLPTPMPYHRCRAYYAPRDVTCVNTRNGEIESRTRKGLAVQGRTRRGTTAASTVTRRLRQKGINAGRKPSLGTVVLRPRKTLRKQLCPGYPARTSSEAPLSKLFRRCTGPARCSMVTCALLHNRSSMGGNGLDLFLLQTRTLLLTFTGKNALIPINGLPPATVLQKVR